METSCCAYPYLNENGSCCDYEIMTDLLACELAAVLPDSLFYEELWPAVALIYHANGSLRGKNAITQEDVDWLMGIYQRLDDQLKIKTFVLPAGCKTAVQFHRLRVMAKACVRLAYRCEKEGRKAEKALLDFLNLLSNTFFLMALWENREAHVEELPFVSKSYDSETA